MLKGVLRWARKRRRAADGVASSMRIARRSDLPAGSADVAFVNHRTTVFNLGDYLSSPRHYYRFVPGGAGRDVVVVGGGVYGGFDFIRKRIAPLSFDGKYKVGWGMGLSRKEGAAETDQVGALARSFDFIAVRDPDNAIDAAPFCPCASVFNAITDIAPGTKTGILLNFDPRASGPNPLAMLGQFEGQVVGTNAVSESDFRTLFGQTSHLVTNSYHTAYWGLLSGRSVGIVGFSSKYDSIRAMFGLDVFPMKYSKGDGAGLRDAIAAVIRNGAFAKLANPDDHKGRFRQMNDDYAKRLVEAGVFSSITPMRDNDQRLSERTREIFGEYVLREWR